MFEQSKSGFENGFEHRVRISVGVLVSFIQDTFVETIPQDRILQVAAALVGGPRVFYREGCRPLPPRSNPFLLVTRGSAPQTSQIKTSKTLPQLSSATPSDPRRPAVARQHCSLPPGKSIDCITNILNPRRPSLPQAGIPQDNVAAEYERQRFQVLLDECVVPRADWG